MRAPPHRASQFLLLCFATIPGTAARLEPSVTGRPVGPRGPQPRCPYGCDREVLSAELAAEQRCQLRLALHDEMLDKKHTQDIMARERAHEAALVGTAKDHAHSMAIAEKDEHIQKLQMAMDQSGVGAMVQRMDMLRARVVAAEEESKRHAEAQQEAEEAAANASSRAEANEHWTRSAQAEAAASRMAHQQTEKLVTKLRTDAALVREAMDESLERFRQEIEKAREEGQQARDKAKADALVLAQLQEAHDVAVEASQVAAEAAQAQHTQLLQAEQRRHAAELQAARAENLRLTTERDATVADAADVSARFDVLSAERDSLDKERQAVVAAAAAAEDTARVAAEAAQAQHTQLLQAEQRRHAAELQAARAENLRLTTERDATVADAADVSARFGVLSAERDSLDKERQAVVAAAAAAELRVTANEDE